MTKTTLDRRLKRLEVSLTPPVQQGITLLIISAATGEIIDLESSSSPAMQTGSHDASPARI